MLRTSSVVVIHNAATADDAGTKIIDCSGARRVSLYFKATGIDGGNGVFTVQVGAGTPGNTIFVTYNKLITNVANTNAQTPTRVASVTLSSNTTAMVTFSDDAIQCFKVPLDVTTNGAYTCVAMIEY